jgi:hypothetical protein
MEHTEEDLRALINSFREGLKLYNKTLTSSLLELKTRDLEHPETELSKLAQLLNAHATKIGIAFRPPVSVNASYEQLRDTSAKMLLIVGVVAQFDPSKWSKLYQEDIINKVRTIVSNYITLLDELEQLDFKDDSKENVEGRLISVAKIWESCKAVEDLMSVGNIGLLKEQIKLSIGIVDDALSELNEWMEEPYVETQVIDLGEDEDKDEEVLPFTIEFASKWTEKIKLLKLLLSSLSKSLPSKVYNGESVDIFNKEQKTLAGQIDDLVCDIFLNLEKDDLESNAKTVQKQSKRLIQLVRELNKEDEKKTKWLDLWNEKFIK